jgi:PAS domain S-box-containing protein
MDFQDKTKEELIAELQQLHNQHESLKLLLEKERQENDEERIILEELILSSEEFIQTSDETPDYNKIAQLVLHISGAKYVTLNIFDQNGTDFTTVAIAGNNEDIQKAQPYFEFEFKNRHWKHDPVRAEKIKKQAITRFDHLNDITGDIISKNTVLQLEQAFNIGDVYIVKISKGNKDLGDFTLLFEKGESLIHSKLVNLYAHQVGMFLTQSQVTSSLQMSEKRYNSMISNISDVIGIMKPDGLIKYNSPNIEKWFGWHPQDLMVSNIWFTVHSDDLDQVQHEFTLLGEANKSIKTFQYRYKCKDETYKPIELTAINLCNDNIIRGILLNYHDISARKKAEDALLSSERKYRLITEKISDIVWLMDPYGRSLFVSPSIEKFTGFTTEEYLNQTINDRFTPESAAFALSLFKEEFFKIRNLKTPPHDYKKMIVMDYRCKDGNIKTGELLITPYFDEQNKFVGLYGVTRDVTERRKAEAEIKIKNEQLIRANTDKDRFISILAHDLKGPFSAIIKLSEILLKNIRNYDIDKIENFVLHINKSTQNTYNLLEDILLWARSQSGKLSYEPQYIILNPICVEVIESMRSNANNKDITITYADAEKINVFADINMVKTILRNLISNAIKFTHNSGHIKIQIEEDDEFVTTSISDNGIGIEPERLARLFEINKVQTTVGTANENGTGLGLLLCKEFVEKHGGKIWAESAVNTGSTFYFTLPQNATL